MTEKSFKTYLRKFTKSRDEAFTKFVLNDDWDAVLTHFKKFGMDLPTKEKETVAKAGVLKAVQECTNIPAEVKAEAAKKCVLMGFRPTMF
jgi:hypothetical protein